MNYKIIENLFINIFQFVSEYRIVVVIIWIAIMYILLRKLAKRDNEFHLKDFFKKKQTTIYSFEIVIIDIIPSITKLNIPQKTEPNKINDSVKKNISRL